MFTAKSEIIHNTNNYKDLFLFVNYMENKYTDEIKSQETFLKIENEIEEFSKRMYLNGCCNLAFSEDLKLFLKSRFIIR
jgi:hypothetical protein